MSADTFIEYIKNNARLIKDFIPKIQYKDNWRFDLVRMGDTFGRSFFRITIKVPDATKRGTLTHRPFMDHHNYMLRFDETGWNEDFFSEHDFPVEPYPLDEETVERWVFDKIVLVETHEAMEFFKVDGEVIYYPQHIDGNPYDIVRRRKELDE